MFRLKWTGRVSLALLCAMLLVTMLLPHPPQPATVAENERAAILALVPYESVDVAAVQDGEWDDPATWGGDFPIDGDDVLIPAGLTVLIDSKPGARLNTIRVDGRLEHSQPSDTQLLVGTIVVTESGRYECGTAVSPITGSAEIVFLDTGDFAYMGFARGLVSLGMVSLVGDERAFTTEVAEVDGRWESLADTSRTVTLRSENPAPTRAGHVMLMHHDQFSVAWTAFVDLGRTDKSKPLSATNPRGRYPLHFHRCGNLKAAPIVTTGVVVRNSPGWGAVNHSSNVVFNRCIGDGCLGSAFTAEAGNERGSFVQCVGINAHGSGDFGTPESLIDEKRRTIGDFGHLGHAVWLQGPHPSVIECVAAGCGSAGFDRYNAGYAEPDTKAVALKASQLIPLGDERDNTAIDCRYGAIHSYAQAMPDDSHPETNVVRRFTAISCGTGHFVRLANVTLRDCTFDGCGVGINAGGNNGYGGPTKAYNCAVKNCGVGAIPTTDRWFGAHGIVNGGWWEDNGTDVLVFPGLPGLTEISGLRPDASIVFAPGIEGKDQAIRERLFYRNTRVVTIDGKRAYFPEQHAEFRPWRAGELAGKTNAEIFAATGKRPLGAIIPLGATNRGEYWSE